MPKASGNAPKKPATAYLLWSLENRESVKKEEPTLSFGQLSKRLGELWKEVPEEERKPYEEKAAEAKEEYQEAMKAYKLTDEYKQSQGKGKAVKGAKKVKKVKDKNAPKKALSAYMCFANTMRPQLREEHPTLKMTDLSKKIGELWSALDESEKKPYEKMQREDKVRYEKEKAAYDKKGGAKAAAKKHVEEDEEEDEEEENIEEDEEDEDEDDDE